MGIIIATIAKLRTLRDVDPTGLDDGETLVWNASAGKFQPHPTGGTATFTASGAPSISAQVSPTFEQTIVSSSRTSSGVVATGGTFRDIQYAVENNHALLSLTGTVTVFVQNLASTDHRMFTASYSAVAPGDTEVLDFAEQATYSTGSTISLSDDNDIHLGNGVYLFTVTCSGSLA